LDSSLDFLSWSFIFKLTFIKQISFIHPCGWIRIHISLDFFLAHV
jgi:hypothetical protein